MLVSELNLLMILPSGVTSKNEAVADKMDLSSFLAWNEQSNYHQYEDQPMRSNL